MICKQCRNRHHTDCPGGSWCDCQHQGTGVPVLTKDARHALVLGVAKPQIGDESLLTIRSNRRDCPTGEGAPC